MISEINNKIKDDNLLKEMNELTKLISESNELVNKQLDHLNKEILIDKIDQLETKPDVDKELNAQFMASAFIGIVKWWIRHQMPQSSEYMAIQVKKLFEKNEVLSNYH
ncbi:TetR-like C-terminal domain-containing protein [Cytobacillus sp. Hz8]|uniref:TetR-like C-terminal domain-containing protein n=1 Tax=Cytobacillus sp. Hz8 TaxID=3347168 RepID=UPI0035D6F665